MPRLALLCCLALACSRNVRPSSGTPKVPLEEAAQLVPKGVTDREG